MSSVHKFTGTRGMFDWDEISPESYDAGGARGVARRWLIGEREGAPYFAMRYFEVEPGGCTSLDEHAHDHGVIVLKGEGRVLLGDREFEIKFGDVVYVSCKERHQFKNTGDAPFGFICVIPNEKLVG